MAAVAGAGVLRCRAGKRALGGLGPHALPRSEPLWLLGLGHGHTCGNRITEAARGSGVPSGATESFTVGRVGHPGPGLLLMQCGSPHREKSFLG